MLLSVIIVSYNTARLTLETINSTLADVNTSKLLKGQTEIWVVDNHSSDSTLEDLRAITKTNSIPINVIENSQNLGFARANNQAIAKSSGEFVLLLNSDTVVKSGSLEHLVKTFQTQPASEATAVLASHQGQVDRLGILAAKLANPDDSDQAQGGAFPNLISLTSHMLFLDDLPIIGKFFPSTQHTGKNTHIPLKNFKNLAPKDWVGGTAMMVKRQVFDEVGMLDEEIFMYGEDIEFCLRAAHHHWDAAIDTQALITHHGSASSSSQNAIIGEMKAYRYIWSKHKPLWQIPVVRVILKVGCLLRILIFGTISRDSQKVQAYHTALGLV